MTAPGLLEREDRAYYARFISEAHLDFTRAEVGTRCLAEQIEPLQHAPGLSMKLRQAYVELHERLRTASSLARRSAKQYSRLYAMHDLGAAKRKPEVTDRLIEDAKLAIDRLNRIELELRDSLDQLREQWTQAEHPSAAWEDVEFTLEVRFKLDPSSERVFYDQLVEPVYFHLSFNEFADDERFRTCLLGDGDNWNDERTFPDHPLRDVRYGYLAHVVIEEASLPWFLLPRIRMVNVEAHVRGEWNIQVAD